MAGRKPGTISIDVIEEYNFIGDVSVMMLTTAGQVVRWAGNKIVEEMRESMGGRGPNPPSEPGQPPHRQSDALYESLEFVELDELRGGVSMLEYGELLNNGTVFIEPRPFIEPAVERVMPQYREHMQKTMREKLRSVAR